MWEITSRCESTSPYIKSMKIHIQFMQQCKCVSCVGTFIQSDVMCERAETDNKLMNMSSFWPAARFPKLLDRFALSHACSSVGVCCYSEQLLMLRHVRIISDL